MSDRLTKNNYWNSQYKDVVHKTCTINTKLNLAMAELNKIFQKNLSKNKEYKFLEIGCAPGAWMHYFNKEFGYEVHGIEYASEGVKLTKKNLKTLGVKGEIFEQDFLNSDLEEEFYDVVASFGFIEHFGDVDNIVEKHLKLLKKNGILILEIPNFKHGNFNYFIQKILRKTILDKHNINIMHLDYFRTLETKFDLEVIEIKYIGKINLGLFAGNKFILWPMWAMQFMLSNIYFIFGSSLFRDNMFVSPYVMAIYKKRACDGAVHVKKRYFC